MKKEKIVTDSWKVHVNSIENDIIDTTLYVHGWFLFWHLYTGMAYATS